MLSGRCGLSQRGDSLYYGMARIRRGSGLEQFHATTLFTHV